LALDGGHGRVSGEGVRFCLETSLKISLGQLGFSKVKIAHAEQKRRCKVVRLLFQGETRELANRFVIASAIGSLRLLKDRNEQG
jgi:hypothetical protein